MKNYPISKDGTYVVPKEDVTGYECVFGTYVESAANDRDDAVFVKEKIHLKDGSVMSQLRRLRNQPRDFFITKPGFRKHEQKKEYEKLERCQKFTTTHREMPRRVAQVLRQSRANPNIRFLGRSPYLYGCDISPVALIKKKYLDNFPDLNDKSNVAVLDLETNVTTEEDFIISGTLSMKNRVLLAVNKWFVGTMPNFEERLQAAFAKHLSACKMKDEDGKPCVRNLIEERKLKLEIVEVENEAEITKTLIAAAHAWKPDFLAFWNVNFDLPKMLQSLERKGIHPADVFSDPSVPPEFRYFRYKEAQRVKTTASGKTMIEHMADLWHVAFAPASFYCIDLMCLYKRLRVTEGNQPSYSLDHILSVNNLGGKLRFEGDEGYSGLVWHDLMQRKFKLEYLVYNTFDCIGVEMLEEKNNDTRSFKSLCGHSDFANFKSTPRRICDDLHYFYMNRGEVMASSSDSHVEELDQYTLSLKDWIVTLPSNLHHELGLKILAEFPGIRTGFIAHVSDLDVAGAYPHTQVILNMSKETTWRELCKIRGISELKQRALSINMTAANTNAVDICRTVYNYPSLDKLLDSFQTDLAKEEKVAKKALANE